MLTVGCRCKHRGRRQRRRHRYSVWRILREIADPIERVPPYGAWLWRLKSDLKM
jgi:hypothetical protein